MTSSTASLSSFEEFYNEWYPRAVRVARRRGLADPEAVASEIMVVFFEKDYLQRYDPAREGASSFEDWINAILYRRLNNAYRDEMRRPQIVGDVLETDQTIEDRSDTEFKLLAMQAFELLRDRYGMELAEVWVSVVKQVAEDSTSSSGYARQWLTAKHVQRSPSRVSEEMTKLRYVITHDSDLREMLNADRWALEAA